ncbi:MAG: SpoIIE family protein phosphatase [Chloroflexi bacterium]|nr:SpoIIE family protein phosphatase [Chloroflexota bacterium]
MYAPFAEWSVATRPLAGETVSGDHYLVKHVPQGLLVAVADGLGHGTEAAAAAAIAIGTLETSVDESLVLLVKQCHEALLGTRGVVLSLASINAVEDRLTWLGVGNVESVLLRAAALSPAGKGIGVQPPRSACEHLLLRSGVVGYELPSLHISQVSIRLGDMLILATDGIRASFAKALNPYDAPPQILDNLFSLYYRGTDDALALAIRYREDK